MSNMVLPIISAGLTGIPGITPGFGVIVFPCYCFANLAVIFALAGMYVFPLPATKTKPLLDASQNANFIIAILHVSDRFVLHTCFPSANISIFFMFPSFPC
jgi:hypothetical protein